MLTKEEAEAKLAKEWPHGSRERQTYEDLLTAYVRLRERLGPKTYISRAQLAHEYGSNSTGTASKFMNIIEAIQSDQPPRRRSERAKSQEQASTQSPLPIQKAFDAVRAALENASGIVAAYCAQEKAELAQQFQFVLQEQQALAETQHRADEERIADQESAAAGAGDEAWSNNSELEELRVCVVNLEGERDALTGRLEQANRAHEIDHVKLSAAETQIASLTNAEAVLSKEISRLDQELKTAAADAALTQDLQTEATVLAKEYATLQAEVQRLQTVVIEAENRHRDELQTLRRELELERQRCSQRETELMALIARAVGHNTDAYGSLS
jgi:DNA repair exonuclease SbcCD ATPase subunit